MSATYHCDRDTCDRSDALRDCDDRFYTLTLPECDWPDCEKHFCSLDCLMFWAAAQPAEVSRG